MKFFQTAVMVVALFATAEAIKIEAPCKTDCEKKAEADAIKKSNKHVEKVVGEAMAKFVAKHEELEERRAGQARTEEKLRETEEREEKGNAAKAAKENAKSVKHAIKDAESKLEHDEEEADKKDKINKAKDD